MQVIAIISEKGGVAKSTTTFSLAGAYAQQGKTVLLLDLDPQGSLTDSFVLPHAPHTVAALFDESPHGELIVPTRFPGISIVPGDRRMKPINCWQPSMPEYRVGQFAIREFLADVGDRFDRVLIDSPPGLEFCAWAAMAAADYVLTPTFADADGVRAIRFTNQEIRRVQASVNPGLVQLGIVLCDHYPKGANHLAYWADLQRDFPMLLFANFIPHAAAFKEARSQCVPISILKPRSAAAKAVGAVVNEMEARIAGTVERREVA